MLHVDLTTRAWASVSASAEWGAPREPMKARASCLRMLRGTGSRPSPARQCVCVRETDRPRRERNQQCGCPLLPAQLPCLSPSPSSETQECLGAPVLRGPPAGQDERGGAAGAHEAAPEGPGPRAQEDAEPGREGESARASLPQPPAPRRPWLSMLGGSRQLGLGQGAELPRVP